MVGRTQLLELIPNGTLQMVHSCLGLGRLLELRSEWYIADGVSNPTCSNVQENLILTEHTAHTAHSKRGTTDGTHNTA